jgi:hypothetical protein
LIRWGQKPLRGAEIRGSDWAAGRELGNGFPMPNLPARRERREEGSRRPNGPEESPAGKSKNAAGSVDPVAAAWQQVAGVGERKAGSRHRFLPEQQADVLRSGDLQLPNGG